MGKEQGELCIMMFRVWREAPLLLHKVASGERGDNFYEWDECL